MTVWWEGKQSILKLREEGKLTAAIAANIGHSQSNNFWNVLIKEEATGVLSNGRRTGRPRVTTAVDERRTIDANRRIRRPGWIFAKTYRDQPQRFGNRVSRTDESEIHLHQKWWKGQSVENERICSRSKWNGLTHDGRQRGEFRSLRNHFFPALYRKNKKSTPCNKTATQNTLPTQKKDFIRVSHWDLNPTERAFSLWKTNKNWKKAAVKAGNSIKGY